MDATPGGIDVAELAELTVGVVTLRDLFAAHALTGFIASFSGEGVDLPKDDRAAKWAYEYADAMLAERVTRSRRSEGMGNDRI